MAGGTVDAATTMGFPVAVESVGVGCQVMTAGTGRHINPSYAAWITHLCHSTMTIRTGDADRSHKIAQTLCLRSWVTGQAKILWQPCADQLVCVKGVDCTREGRLAILIIHHTHGWICMAGIAKH